MQIVLQREPDNGITTLGKITFGNNSIFSLEDPYHAIKIKGETRISEGEYEILLRTEGRYHEIMRRRYSFHRGMLWLQDVPNFEWILIHPGLTAKDTEGCILTGNAIKDENSLSDSRVAYLFLYGFVMAYFDSGDSVSIKIIDG